jgi:DNA-binding beta-propeller fold protein YncE
MTKQVRLVLMLIVALGVMGLASCDHYTCKVTFGSSACGSGGGGGLSQGGGGGGNAALAFGYYVSNTQVQSFELGPQASLLNTPNFLPQTLPTNPHSAMAIAQEQFLYLPYGTGQLFAWSIDGGSGALQELNWSPLSAPYLAGLAQSSQPLTPIITDPSGNFLYIADTTDSLIYAFSIDPSTGLLTPVPLSPFASVVPPWNLATDGAGKFLYVSQANAFGEGQAMAVFTINSGTGALSAGTAMAFNMWQVQGEPTGQFMIGVDGHTGLNNDNTAADDHLYVFPINPATGVLQTPTAVPTTNGPIGVIVHPNGKFVYDFSIVEASGFDGPLEGFSLDPTTGILTSLGAPFSSLTTIPYGGFFDQSGSYMFVHSSNAVGVLNIDPTTGIPTEPSTPIGIGSDEPWAITDVP